MTPDEMKARTKRFSLRCMKVAEVMPATVTGRTVAGQFVRAGTSVGANYRAACRARSDSECIAKMGVVEEEADECGFWMELMVDGGLLRPRRLADLQQEAEEILRMACASIQTARGGRRQRKASANPQSAIRNPQ